MCNTSPEKTGACDPPCPQCPLWSSLHLYYKPTRVGARIDDDGFAAFGEVDEFVEGIFREMVLAVHVEQSARPDFVAFEGFEERTDPEWFDEKEIEAFFGAAALDAMDEKSVGIQLMRHD